MKKGLIVIFTFIFAFCFANTVHAAQPQRCMYEGTNDDGSKFKVLVRTYEDDDYIWIQPLDDVRVKKLDKDYGSSDLWTSIEFGATIEVKDSNSKYNGKDLKGSIIEENGCFNYLYWQAPVGLDNWYFSNNSNQSIGGTDKIVRLNLVNNYQDTSSNAILEELICTYTQPNGAYGSMPDTIVYRLTKNNNGYSYEILGESSGLLKTWYEGEASADQNGWNSALLGMNVNTQVLDLLNPRVFWYSHSKAYSCPSMIMVGYDYELTTPSWSSVHSFNTQVSIGFATDELDNYLDDNIVEQLSDLMSSVENAEHKANYTLAKGASFIDYEVGVDKQGNICNYGIESEMATNLDNWYYSIAEVIPFGEEPRYTAITNDAYPNLVSPTTFDIPSGKLMNSCDDLPILYTDCLKENASNCKISINEFEGSTKLVQNTVLNEMDKTTVELAMSKYNGLKYKIMVCELGDQLDYLAKRDDKSLSMIDKLEFHDADGTNEKLYGINELIANQCDNWGINTLFDCSDSICQSNLDYIAEQKIKEIQNYCNEMYSGFTTTKLQNQSYKGRMDECIQFQSFYSSLVTNGIIRDLSNGCEMLSNDFVDKLVWILDIIKIAGPILAVGLGTLDFVKVVASGDADKEMKSAFKRFGTRIVAAVLLFLVPVILAFLMDTFLGNQAGYDSDNPFCDIVEFNE